MAGRLSITLVTDIRYDCVVHWIRIATLIHTHT